MPVTGPIAVILFTDQVPLWLPVLPRGRQFNPASYAGSSCPAGFVTSLHASTGMSALSVAAHTHSPTVSRQRLGEDVGSLTAKVEMDPRVLKKGPSSVRVTVLKHLLKDYPDQAAASYLLHVFSVGLFIPY